MNQRSGSGGGGSDYDTEVSHYSISELLDLVGLSGVEDIGEAEFSEVIQGFVNKYREIDITLSRFFSDVGLTLLRLFRPPTTGGGVAWGGTGDGDGDGDAREGLAMRSTLLRGGNNSGVGGGGSGGADADAGGAEKAEGGDYDDYMGGVGEGDYGDDDDAEDDAEDGFDPNDIMGLRRDLKRGLVSGSQQLKWEKNQYLDDGEDGGGNGAYVNRSNKVKIFRDENGHYQMKQKKIGISSIGVSLYV
jgi:hypothetical protein